MAIWEHRRVATERMPRHLGARCCPHCKGKLFDLPKIVFERDDHPERSLNELRACLTCGWWTLHRTVHRRFYPRIEGIGGLYGATAVLREFSAADLREPLGEVRAFLLARWERRGEVNPHVFQDVVASVFRDRGWTVLSSAHRNDGGIDIVLDRCGEQSAVQVKHTKNTILAEQIRAFLGALVLGRITKGIYVTTARFSAGSKRTANEAAQVSRYIDLIDAEAFLRDLGIAQRESWKPDPHELLQAARSSCHYLGSVMERPFPEDAVVYTLRRAPDAGRGTGHENSG